MKIGDVVVIRSGINRVISGTGNISAISETKKRVDVTLSSGVTTSFYRVDGKHPDPNTYVNNPGAGNFGAMLNDRFKVDEIGQADEG